MNISFMVAILEVNPPDLVEWSSIPQDLTFRQWADRLFSKEELCELK